MSMTLAGTSRGGVPRARLIIAILAVSLALNVCVIAGVVWNHINPPATQSATERFRKLERSLDLNDSQRAAFERYAAASRLRNVQLRQDLEPLLEAAWAEIGKDQPNEAVVLQSFNDASTRWRATQRETVEATLALLATLTPDQRAKFIAAERDRRAEQRRRHVEEGR